MYEISRQLNTVLDVDTALTEVSRMMKKSMGADRCEVILKKDFENISDMQFPRTIADAVIRQKSAVVIPDMASSDLGSKGSSSLYRIRSALCVPVMAEEEVIALIYMYKTDVAGRPFGQKDLQLAVAISHQTALTIQRMDLLEKVREETRGREMLQRFLSPAEAEYMLEEYMRIGHLPGLEMKEVTVLFADLANSTPLAERVGANRFGEILTRYYWDVSDMVFENGGLVKFLGDGIMAVFGMIESKPDDPLRAVKAGLAILQHMETADYGDDVELIMGIGVNSGTAMVGYVGTQQRVELATLGDVVNVSFLLQSLARPNRLLIGADTAVGVAGNVELKDLGTQDLKGREKPFRTFEVLRS